MVDETSKLGGAYGPIFYMNNGKWENCKHNCGETANVACQLSVRARKRDKWLNSVLLPFFAAVMHLFTSGSHGRCKRGSDDFVSQTAQFLHQVQTLES